MAAKASLHSTASNSSTFMPERSSSLWVTGTGAESTMAASSAVTAKCAKRARTGRPERLGDRAVGDQHGGRAVGGLRRVTRRDVGGRVGLPALRRRQGGERLDRRAAADALVAPQELPGEAAVLRLDRHGKRFALEVPVVPALRRPPVRLERVGVHLRPRDPVALGQHLADPELGPQAPVDLLHERGRERPGPAPGVRGQRHPAHDLDPAGDDQVVVARGHPGGGEVHGLLGRAALAVDRGGRHASGAVRPTPSRCGRRSCSARPPGSRSRR